MMNFPRPQKCDYIVKIATFGAKQTGKTNILSRLCYDYFSGVYKQTIGIDFFIQNFTLAQKKLRLQFWDIQLTPKSESSQIRELCLRGVIGLIFIYSISDASSFEYIQKLISTQYIKDYLKPDILKILIANKMDLSLQGKVNKEVGENLAKSFGMIFMEVSAKDCTGVKELNVRIGTELLEIIRKHQLG